MKNTAYLLSAALFATVLQAQEYPVVHTGITEYSNTTSSISAPAAGLSFYGQDADYQNNTPNYTNNNNGTITDNVTGLMWQQDPGQKMSFPASFTNADTCTLGGHTDWRVPTIKELFSLIMFYGWENTSSGSSIKFIDTDYFIQAFGNESIGERYIDAQTWSATEYVSTTMNSDATVFGVNFIDGRIKGYPKYKPGTGETELQTMHCRLVRGNTSYGQNNFVDNGNGTISDLATGLMWQQTDDGTARNWQEALAYAENLQLAEKTDWRLPNIKELQSIVDYGRSPKTTQSPAIDTLFSCTEITDPDGNAGQYPYYWSGTTHKTGPAEFSNAAYIAFGEAQGIPRNKLLDVHGAGAQRSDPKTGNAVDYPKYHGPQGDVQYVYNYVRAVRTMNKTDIAGFNNNSEIKVYPTLVENHLQVQGSALTEIKYTIHNIHGKLLKSSIVSDNIAVNDLNPGIYFIAFTGKAILQVDKFIKL